MSRAAWPRRARGVEALKWPDRVHCVGVRFGEVGGDLLEAKGGRTAVAYRASMFCGGQGAVGAYGGRERFADLGGGWGGHIDASLV